MVINVREDFKKITEEIQKEKRRELIFVAIHIKE